MARTRIGALVGALSLATAVAGCGGATKHDSPTAASSSASSSRQAGALPPAVAELPAAETPTAGQFPAPGGRTLQQLAKLVRSSAQFGAATGTFTPGARRLAFALTTTAGAFIYAPTAVYLAAGPNAHDVKGPFLAPADPMNVAPSFRSRQNQGPGGIDAIYAARVPVPHAGTYTVLS